LSAAAAVDTASVYGVARVVPATGLHGRRRFFGPQEDRKNLFHVRDRVDSGDGAEEAAIGVDEHGIGIFLGHMEVQRFECRRDERRASPGRAGS
jgi:hypothetical protein